MSAEADQYGNELRTAKGEISELNRMISRLQNEIQAVKAQVSDRFTSLRFIYPLSPSLCPHSAGISAPGAAGSRSTTTHLYY